ncbi:RagB/SusD family nutrient uptake outer membrane protein [Hymenobacter armeniacus]|uniref:RagB/SusD family nutrient uptake outer membrane protein n=1 Tax=Hymenobacter armeniacus TaxID=2771358 RepID=A0ABR8JW63_9BACT|nr:RagB/SusD family nutrient uptake outer membrane protein [Hymenobacter armeniacus]MBD2724118.1 RagB/SusD family nutrient uptake outer membrane protein [Hymenobacter armeniacus]
MKKLIIGLATASLLVGGLGSCNKKLDVEPVDTVDAANALNTSSDVEAALVGSYTGLQSDNAYVGYIQFLSDLLADNGDVDFVGTYQQPQQLQRKTILKDNSTVANIWLRAYSTVNRVNNVLANLGKLDTPAKRTRIEGEARFIRGLVYFDLVRLYARDWNDGTPQSNPGVPLVLTPTTTISPANSVSRNTVAEVYAQVIADLTAAENQLPASNGIFANKYAAAAVLSRVYLQQNNYAGAANAATRVIASNSFSLNANYADNFGNGSNLSPNTPEDIFAIQVNAQTSIADPVGQFYSEQQRADVEIQSQFLSLFEPGDDRLSVYSITAGAPTYTTKYDALYGNIKLIRLDEMYLTRAEANFRAGTTVGATPLADINRIRARAKLAPLVTLTINSILKERRIELAFEGFRLGDLKRNRESTVDPATGAAIPWNSSRLVFPIPLREINANPNLTQNPGY